MLETLSRWTLGEGPNAEYVVSSRVRLARNLKDYSFPHLLNREQAQEIIDEVQDITAQSFSTYQLREYDDLGLQVLIEKHLISLLLAEQKHNSALVIGDDDSASIMVNEEDHFRLQSIMPGLELRKGLYQVQHLDNLLEEHLEFAFSEQIGYLTACPTNVGTGLRASVMLHLPALVMTGQIGPVLSTLSKFGVVVRGLYGEGTEALGNLFQISNQITLGPEEEEIISNLELITNKIIEQEKLARKKLTHDALLRLEDRVGRALGTLTNARIINSAEAMKHLSDVRLGIDLGIISDIPAKAFNELLLLMQPAMLQALERKKLTAMERDIKRASVIREHLSKRMEGR